MALGDERDYVRIYVAVEIAGGMDFRAVRTPRALHEVPGMPRMGSTSGAGISVEISSRDGVPLAKMP